MSVEFPDVAISISSFASSVAHHTRSPCFFTTLMIILYQNPQTLARLVCFGRCATQGMHASVRMRTSVRYHRPMVIGCTRAQSTSLHLNILYTCVSFIRGSLRFTVRRVNATLKTDTVLSVIGMGALFTSASIMKETSSCQT